MNNFTYEEVNLMALYNTGSRERLIESLTEMRGVSNRTVKENQKERSVYVSLDEVLDILISQGQNDYKPGQKRLLRLEDSLIFLENICSAAPMSEYNGASRH